MSQKNSSVNEIEIDENGNLLYPVTITPKKIGISGRISREMERASNDALYAELMRVHDEGTNPSAENAARILGVERGSSITVPTFNDIEQTYIGVDFPRDGTTSRTITTTNGSTLQIHHGNEELTSNLGDLF